MSNLLNEAVVYIDGASRGNPGDGAMGMVIISPEGIRTTSSKVLGRVTNNEAEFLALKEALKICAENKYTHIQVFTDSKLVANSVTGKWKLKSSPLIKIVKEIALMVRMMPGASIHVDWVSRESDGIKEADKLANEILNPNIIG